jgi:hypothetical protein
VKKIRKRLTYANVMSSIAVFLVLGGATALAAGLAKNSVGSKQLKKNAVTAAKIKKNAVTGAKIKANAVVGSKVKDQSLTGADINLGTLGTVPSATHANSAGTADNANNANSLTGFRTFAGSGADNTVTTLLSTGSFDVVGICNEEETFEPAGFQNTRLESAIGIVNRGQDNGWADSWDDEDEDFDIGDGIAFDYLDFGDMGSAILQSGQWIHVIGGIITEARSTSNFGSGCTFHGLAYFG